MIQSKTAHSPFGVPALLAGRIGLRFSWPACHSGFKHQLAILLARNIMNLRKSSPLSALPLLLALSVGCGGASTDAGAVVSVQPADNAETSPISAADLNAQSGAIVVYEHCYYGGASQTFYYPRDINSFYKSLAGNWNDRISSIRVFGAAARIFEHDNWHGASITFSSDIACMSWYGFDNVASSLEWL
jgi:hypothetical protein